MTVNDILWLTPVLVALVFICLYDFCRKAEDTDKDEVPESHEGSPLS